MKYAIAFLLCASCANAKADLLRVDQRNITATYECNRVQSVDSPIGGTVLYATYCSEPQVTPLQSWFPHYLHTPATINVNGDIVATCILYNVHYDRISDGGMSFLEVDVQCDPTVRH